MHGEGAISYVRLIMKYKITLKMRITLIVATVIITIAASMTFFSISSSFRYFAYEKLDSQVIDQSEFNILEQQLEESKSKLDSENKVDNLEVDIKTTEAHRNFNREQLIAMIFISFAGILITYYVVGKALSPLTQLSKKVEQIDENSLDTQLIVPSSNDEIHKLSLAFNSMMLKLKTSFSSQKTFASNAAHELKTPLSIMKSSLQVLCLVENPTKEDYKENVVVMLESVDRLSEIINELLLISSPIEQNTLIQFDLLIENSIEKLQTRAEKRNIKITSILENTAIYSNEVLLNSIVENLLSNAIKYNKDEGEIFISLKNHQNGINLELSDTGIGISEDQFSLIFEAFYRVDSSRLKNISGCGLGLQIVKSALEKINGTIDVKSSIGEGTTFNVFIPKKNS